MRQYEIDDLVKVAKRENNAKRSYLYVNPLQGKHIPVSPSLSLELFGRAGKLVEEKYRGERIFLIGFAETATAIGASIACCARNVEYYCNTTRENIKGADYLLFTESHSHATEQRLVTNGLEAALSQVDRIVFAEDEVTTGNTILKLINAISARYPKMQIRFGIVSLLNSMPESRLWELKMKGIECDYLYKVPSQYRISETENYKYKVLRKNYEYRQGLLVRHVDVDGYWNSRIACETAAIKERLNAFTKQLLSKPVIDMNSRRILIVGTEEFMFPGMLFGACLERENEQRKVWFHATTRSPIEVCDDASYPLHERYPLLSLYDDHRNTFIYNLTKYDQVLIVTDAPQVSGAGLESLAGALLENRNTDVTLIHWG